MRCARSQLSKGHQLFRLYELRLQPFQVFDGLLGLCKQPRTVPVGQVAAQENQQGQRNSGDESGHQPEIAHRGRLMADKPGTQLLREIRSNRKAWWPVAGGMFGGDWERAEAATAAFTVNEAQEGARRW